MMWCLAHANAFADADAGEALPGAEQMDAGAPGADAGAPVLKPDAGPPALDVREPPFATGDYSWMNGNNYQPQPMFVPGPFTWTLLLDVYYGYDFNKPEDHTIFPATTASAQ